MAQQDRASRIFPHLYLVSSRVRGGRLVAQLGRESEASLLVAGLRVECGEPGGATEKQVGFRAPSGLPTLSVPFAWPLLKGHVARNPPAPPQQLLALLPTGEQPACRPAGSSWACSSPHCKGETKSPSPRGTWLPAPIGSCHLSMGFWRNLLWYLSARCCRATQSQLSSEVVLELTSENSRRVRVLVTPAATWTRRETSPVG